MAGLMSREDLVLTEVGLPKEPLFQGGLNPRLLSDKAASNRSRHAEKSCSQH